MAENKLFEEFPPLSTAQWEEAIQKDLKGADYDKKLIWKTAEGFPVRPYYREEDLAQLAFIHARPGEFPFVRGNHPEGNNWEIRQDVWVDHPADANKKALELLNLGVNGIRFCFCNDARMKFLNEASFNILLRNIFIDCISLHFSAGNRTKDVLSLLKDFCLRNNIDPKRITGTVDFNVFGTLTSTGDYYESDTQDVANLVVAVQKARKHFPGIRIIGIEGSLFRNAGSILTQELAFSLSMGNDYLDLLTGKGISVEDAFQSLHFTFATGPVYFLEIAKIRAARLLWSRMAQAWKISEPALAKMQIHSETCNWDKTLYDPYVNMLRNTTEAMAAVLGGSDSLTVKAFDAAYRIPNDFSERIARNVQLILKEEAGFDRVADPAAGSYYIETLVQSLVDAAWDLFLLTEAKGGYRKCLTSGFIQEQVEASAKSKWANISSRREILLGTNQYPNFREFMKDQVQEETAFPRAIEHPTTVKPLTPGRGAQYFEKMRLKTEKSAAPARVFMLTIGNLAMRIARANFSCNFFAAAGFELIDNLGFDSIEAGIDAALEASSDIVVLCSSDDEYALLAPQAKDLLERKGKTGTKKPLLVVAGAPACMEELKSAGITRFIHLRSNLLQSLEEFQKELNIL